MYQHIRSLGVGGDGVGGDGVGGDGVGGGGVTIVTRETTRRKFVEIPDSRGVVLYRKVSSFGNIHITVTVYANVLLYLQQTLKWLVNSNKLSTSC